MNGPAPVTVLDPQDPFWDRLREQYPLLSRRTYLNNASVQPLPAPVAHAVAEFARRASEEDPEVLYDAAAPRGRLLVGLLLHRVPHGSRGLGPGPQGRRRGVRPRGRHAGGRGLGPGPAANGGGLFRLPGGEVAGRTQRMAYVTGLLREELSRAGVPVLCPADPLRPSSILLLETPRPQEDHARLAAAGISTSFRMGRVRLSPHVYNGPGDFRRLVEVLGERA